MKDSTARSHSLASDAAIEGRARFGNGELQLSVQVRANAALHWARRSWNITSGRMAGVCAGDPANVSLDANGYLHLKLTKNGYTWSAAEITDDAPGDVDQSASCSLSEPGNASRNGLAFLGLLPAWLLARRARRRSTSA